jgi:arsenical pump membrane protein
VSGEIVSFALLAAVLVAAVLRPHGLPEAVVAVPAALIAWSTGLIDTAAVHQEWHRLWPILVFLAAVLVLAQLCAAEGLFEAAGHWLARSSRGSPGRLLVEVFALSAAVTSVLSLDATVVLLTPVVLATAARMRVPARPHVYATGHLANTASLLLPMGNLTNLLALAATGLTLVHFAAAMAMPWIAVLLVEYVVMRLYFRSDLAEPAPDVLHEDVDVPSFAVVILALTLVGFVVTSFLDVEPYWVALIGAVVLLVHTLARGLIRPGGVVRAIDIPFLCFVLGLAVVVRAVVDNGLGDWIDGLLPSGDDLMQLLAFAAIAAVLANVVNNLPALLILLTPAAEVSSVAVLAVLIGVNVGPNLTYTGSLATLLWRRVLQERDLQPSLRRFTVLGLLTVPLGIVLAVVALWAGVTLWSLG